MDFSFALSSVLRMHVLVRDVPVSIHAPTSSSRESAYDRPLKMIRADCQDFGETKMNFPRGQARLLGDNLSSNDMKIYSPSGFSCSNDQV